MENFIPISRDIVDHWIYKDAEYFKVWFEMLHRARYSEEPKTDMEKGQVYTIHRGEFMFGRPSWSGRLGISEQRLKTLMKKLTDHDMISLVCSYRYFSIYRLNNYENYNKINQQSNQQSNQQKHLEPQGFEQCVNQQSNQQTNLLSTSCQPAANLLSTTKEERSNKGDRKEEEGSKKKPIVDSNECDQLFEQFWSYYPKRDGKKTAKEKWRSYYKKGEIDFGKVMDGLERYKLFIDHERNVRGFDRQYLAGSTFVNQKQWESEWKVQTSVVANKSKSQQNQEQRNLIIEKFLGGVSSGEFEQGRSRIDVTPNQNSISIV